MSVGARQQPTALLIDLDGVLRVFDRAVIAEIEQRHGLPTGALLASALSWPRLRPVLVGEWSDDEWHAAVVADLAAQDPTYRPELQAATVTGDGPPERRLLIQLPPPTP